jgi:hypothetical protein
MRWNGLTLRDSLEDSMMAGVWITESMKTLMGGEVGMKEWMDGREDGDGDEFEKLYLGRERRRWKQIMT